jgi:hypothetical protein
MDTLRVTLSTMRRVPVAWRPREGARTPREVHTVTVQIAARRLQQTGVASANRRDAMKIAADMLSMPQM